MVEGEVDLGRRTLLQQGASAAGLLALGSRAVARDGERATVFHGGPILTMEDAAPAVEALAIRNGIIVAAGSLEVATAAAKRGARRFDLQGRTLLPGFFDPHGHVSMVGLQARYANLLPAPDGAGDSISALQSITREWMGAHESLVRRSQLVIGFGYDDSQLREQRHPTRVELDAISSDVPILFLHQSGHVGAVNTAALAAAQVTAATADPEGGIFRREQGAREPNGVLEENALFAVMGTLFTRMDAAANQQMVREGAAFYASFGYTTCQDGRSSTDTCRLIQSVAEQRRLPIDVLAFADILTSSDALASSAYRRDYVGHFRIGGVKLTLDGSPQAKTAWLSQPYHVPPAGRSLAYAGYPAITQQQAMDSVDLAFARGWQIEVHANGDAAIDLLIAAVREATARHGAADRRPVLIHGQVTREDQMDGLQALGIVPSFFPMHTFYWGDWHRDSVLGPRRAENISPCGWALQRGMRFTSHHDAPVANPNAMRVLSATVTRRTRSGDILGPAQRVPVDVALKAMTLWAAWQHFEDDRKGSLSRGKLADLVVLSENPLTVDPGRLAEIAVTHTFKEGREVFTGSH